MVLIDIATAEQRNYKTVGEERNCAVSFEKKLDENEIMDGTPVVLEHSTSDLAISAKKINDAQIVVNGVPVASGRAVQFHVTGGLANKEYVILITAVTNSTPPQTVKGRTVLGVLPDV
jgi:hypothetical protein